MYLRVQMHFCVSLLTVAASASVLAFRRSTCASVDTCSPMAAASAAGGSGEKVLWQYQDDLPSLPVPKLEDTMRRFLRSAEVFLSPDELQHTKAVIADFQRTAGPELQAILEDKASDSRNWVRLMLCLS